MGQGLGLTYIVAVAILLSLLIHTIWDILNILFKRKLSRPKNSISQELATTLAALEANSKQATDLLARLQSEISDRTKTVQQMESDLKQLQEKRTLLELTDDQKKAIEALVRRQPTPREIFTSLDFWLGRVFVSALFFIAGLTVNLLAPQIRSAFSSLIR